MVHTAFMPSAGNICARLRQCEVADIADLCRIAEAQLRAMNNLLERLHASFFLYLLPEPFQFLSVASYLSAPILLGAALTISGLRKWRTAPTKTAVQSLAWLLFSSAIYAFVGISAHFVGFIKRIDRSELKVCSITISFQLSDARRGCLC